MDVSELSSPVSFLLENCFYICSELAFSQSTRKKIFCLFHIYAKNGHSFAHFDRFRICRYPKDAEKHLLAIKSGLTRSQVLGAFATSLDLILLVKHFNPLLLLESKGLDLYCILCLTGVS